METLLLDTDDIDRVTDMEAIIDAVSDAFAAYERGDATMPAKSYIDLPQYNGDFRSMPAYVGTDEWEGAAVKWVNSHPENPERFDLPTVMGTLIYSDPETAVPLSIMDGTELTLLRTGAAAAVATDHLAIESATTMGIVGAGVQASAQLEAIATVRPIDEVIVADKDQDRIDTFIDTYGDEFSVRGGTIDEAAGCDVVSTVTPVREPIVDRAAVGERTHINAMGADAAGKQELDPAILQDATIVIDNYEQCTHSGEINTAWSEGLIDDDDIAAELATVVANGGLAEAADGITVFDSTGLAIQDVAAAHAVYTAASEQDIGTTFELISP